MNYTILFGNLILIILILLVIIYLLKDKIKESFFNNPNNCEPEVETEMTLDEEGRPIPIPYSPPPDYNPNIQHLCKNIGWTNSGTPYKMKRNQS